MNIFNIKKLSTDKVDQLKHKIDNKTKPPGSLGVLEELAIQIGQIQKTTTPKFTKPTICVFAGDHGIVNEGVSPFPQEVTYQMVYNFLSGGAAINVFGNQNEIEIKVIDSGVNHDFEDHPKLIKAKVGPGTKSYLTEPAMTSEDCEKAVEHGAKIVSELHSSGTNVVGFGEMGIGNTSSAAILMSLVCNMPIEECVGAGTGLNSDGIKKKAQILKKAMETHKLSTDSSPMKKLSTFGGFESAMITGAMLKAAELNMVILVDGFIVTSALLVAAEIDKNVLDYCVFSHVSDEAGHKMMLKHLNAKPIISLNMRLGEGTGAAVAYPIVKSALSFINEMASFESANVSNKE
jgi:nicotinate-nucleotide--dimethylbenzimidazole phosphoribosyltransferase